MAGMDEKPLGEPPFQFRLMLAILLMTLACVIFRTLHWACEIKRYDDNSRQLGIPNPPPQLIQ
jgi:hypothetical protein